jgi:hypothetical protein
VLFIISELPEGVPKPPVFNGSVGAHGGQVFRKSNDVSVCWRVAMGFDPSPAKEEHRETSPPKTILACGRGRCRASGGFAGG